MGKERTPLYDLGELRRGYSGLREKSRDFEKEGEKEDYAHKGFFFF